MQAARGSWPYHHRRIPTGEACADTPVVSANVPRKFHVLLVDDDESLRPALARAIRLAGFDVEVFSSAETLLARGIHERDACLVLDVDLPGIDGFACQRMLEASGRNVPTVFITALSPAEISDPIAARRSVAMLYKPFNKDDLIAAIGRACG